MTALRRLALAIAYLAAAAMPCAQSDAGAQAQGRMRAHAASALHAHGAAPEAADGELRAPCPCGCDESPAAAFASGLHGAALVPAALNPLLPRAVHLHTAAARGSHATGELPDPVPRAA